jgi:hypothetical protein
LPTKKKAVKQEAIKQQPAEKQEPALGPQLPPTNVLLNQLQVC